MFFEALLPEFHVKQSWRIFRTSSREIPLDMHPADLLMWVEVVSERGVNIRSV